MYETRRPRRGESCLPASRSRLVARTFPSSFELLFHQRREQLLLTKREIVLVVFRVREEHVNERFADSPVVDHPDSATLAFPAFLLTPAYLPEPAGILDQISCVWLHGLSANDCILLRRRI